MQQNSASLSTGLSICRSVAPRLSPKGCDVWISGLCGAPGATGWPLVLTQHPRHLPTRDGPQNNPGTPPRCRHVVLLVQSWDFVQVFIRKQARVLQQLWARKLRLISSSVSPLDGIKKAKRGWDESTVPFSPQENYICFLRTSNDSLQAVGKCNVSLTKERKRRKQKRGI